MQNKMIAVGVLVVGVSVLGAGIWAVGVGSGSGGEKSVVGEVVEVPERVVAATPPAMMMEIPETNEQAVAEIPEQLQGRQGRRGGSDIASRLEGLIRLFDADGDGILSAEERQVMWAARQAEMMARVDLDGDGVLSLKERVAARRNRILESGRIARYDLDGDGVLSEDELAAMNNALAGREKERMSQELERYDADGDGVLSPEEQAAQQRDRIARQEQRIQRFSQEFDQDGDGDLNADERADAFDAIRNRREMGQFMNQYDTGKDGEIGATEYEAFLSAYAEKERFADVNRDGKIDVEDVMAFRDYVERAKLMSP